MPRKGGSQPSSKMRLNNLPLFLTIFYALIGQVASMCEMGDLWQIRQFEPANVQYWANWLNICPSQKLPCNGEIQEWNFFSTSDDGSPIYLSIWRQIEPTGFKLVGYNEVNATRVGTLRFRIDKGDRIRAKAGDVFGVFYEHRDSTGSVAFISGVGSSGTASNHVLHSCVSQQFTKDEILQYMESNGRITLKGHQTTRKLFMVQAFVHDENEVVRVKVTEEPIPSCGPIPQIPNAIIINYQPSGARVHGLLGDTIEYECRDTYRLVGPHRVRCNADQTWSKTPICEATVFCGPPPLIDNAYCAPELSRADTGTVVRYTCEPGYALGGPLSRVTNFSLIVCQDNGTWSAPPSCERVESYCGLPPTVSFATAIPLYDTNRKTAVYGDSVRYKCDVGYFMMGNDTVTCGRDGRWSDQLPRCGGMYRLCDNKLPDVENAQVVYSSTEPFSVAFYICRHGFMGEGTRAHIRCLPDGTWEKPEYKCGRKLQHVRVAPHTAQQYLGTSQCKNPPPQVENAIVIVRSTEPGAPATYLCLEDYRPIGNSTVICGDDGVWRGDPDFTCILQPLTQGLSSLTTSTPLTTLTIQRIDETTMAVETETVPTDEMTTTVATSPPVATVTCGDPPTVERGNGWQLYRGRPSQPGDIVKYLCADKFTLVGNISVVCQPNGQWSTLPVCQMTQLDCDWPPDIPHAVLVSNIDGLEASYECDQGYRKVGGITTIMCYEGQWSKPLFTCNPLQCADPPIVRNADWVPKGPASPGTIVIYECNSGTKMVGSDSIVCQTSGEWTSPPDCIEMISCGPPPTIPNAIIVSSTGMAPAMAAAVMAGLLSGNSTVPTLADVINSTGLINAMSSPGSSVTYGCLNGYRLLQNRTTTYCQNDRKWSEPLPSCEASLYKLEYLAAFWPLSKRFGVRDISGHSFHGAAPILLSFQPATGQSAPMASIAEFGPNRYVEIRHYRDQFNYAAKSFSYVMHIGPSTVDGPILEYDSVGGRLGFHIWIQAAQLYVFYEPKYYLYSGFNTAAEIKSPKLDLRKWNFVASVYNFPSGTASLWLDDQKLAEKYVGHLYPEMSQGFYIGQHKRPTGDPRQFQGQQIACVGAYKVALEANDLSELKKMCLRLLNDEVQSHMSHGQQRPSIDGVLSNKVIQEVMPIGVPPGPQQQVSWTTDPTWGANSYNNNKNRNNDLDIVSTMTFTMSPQLPLELQARENSINKVRSMPLGSSHHNRSAANTLGVVPPMNVDHNSISVVPPTTPQKMPEYQPVKTESGQIVESPVTPSSEVSQSLLITQEATTFHETSTSAPITQPQTVLVPNTVTHSTASSIIGTSCGRVPYVSNAMVSDGYSNGSSHVGDTATYRCFTGYQLVGGATIHCHPSGEWSMPPRCIDKLGGGSLYPSSQCPEAPQIVNADILFSNKSIGGVTLYRCQHGFALAGSALAFCQSDGAWSELPSCSKVDCGRPPPVNNGEVRFLETSFGSQAFYTCNSGYQLQGFQIATCTETGVWFQVPVCHGMACPPPQPVANSNMIPLRGDGRSPGSAFKIVCKLNYKIPENINDTLTCHPDGTWTKAPTCEEIECGGLPVISNGIIRPPTVVSEPSEHNRLNVRTVTVTCQTGYRLKGPATITCNGDGTWSKPPTCEQFSCDVPQNIENASFNYTSLLPGSVVSYSCNHGFRPTGTIDIRCSADGRWIGQPPVCREMLCPPPIVHPGTSFSFSSERLNVGTTLVLTCYNGSALEGNNTATCQLNGQWSKMGRCLPVTCGLPPQVNNSFIVRLDGYNFSNSVVYSCKEGFTMVGPSTVTCTAKATWGETPRCDPPPCQAPQLIDHGSVNFRTPITAGTQAMYACSPGYELIGSANITCQQTGQWNDLPPNCQALTCGNPPEIPNSMVTIFCNSEVCTVGEKAIYECPPQWHLVGSPLVTCMPDRKWSHVPTCISKTARASEGRTFFPNAVNYFKRGRPFRTYGHHHQTGDRNYSKNRFSTLTNEATRNSGQSGNNNNGLQPVVVESGQPSTSSIITHPTSETLPETEVTSFMSFPPFIRPDGDESAENVVGESPAVTSPPSEHFQRGFTEDVPPWGELSTVSTDLITCGQAPFVPNSLVSFSFIGEGSKPGDTARYACSGNFQMRGPDVVVCLDSGHWSVSPACESPCPMLSLPNGFVTYYNHSVQTVVTETDENEDMQHTMPTYRSLNNLYHDELKTTNVPSEDFSDQSQATLASNEGEGEVEAGVSEASTLLDEMVESSPTKASRLLFGNHSATLSDQPMLAGGQLQFEFRYTSSVHEGTVARFSCESSYDTVGPREAICQKDGSWSAPVPKCTACHQMSLGHVPPAIVLNEVAYLMSPNMTLFLDMRFNCSGRLTSWVYYCRSREAEQAAGVYLAIWRPILPIRASRRSRDWQDRATEFRLVGKTFVKPRQYGFNVHNLTEREAIEVKFGDIIGYHYAVPAIPARYLTVPIATQRDPWPFDASTLSRAFTQAYTDRDIIRDENIVRLRAESMPEMRQIPAIKAVLSPSFVRKK